MTYNVLADEYIDGQVRRALNAKNKQSIYTLEFGFRFEKIMEEIERAGSDVVALQEVDHLDQYIEGLKGMGYDVQTSGRENDDNNYQTGLIAYKKDKF